MSFWLGFCLFVVLVAVSASVILLISNKKEKEKYIFRTEEGEEIPLGI
jgi:hypothetical protein